MRDAIEVEWAGVAAAAVIAEPLVGSAEAMKRLSGMPDYQYCVVPYPVGNLSPEEIRSRAREAAPRIIGLLTSAPGRSPRPEGSV